MADNIVRVYHPRGPAWYDVNKSDLASWLKAGWLENRPGSFPTDDDKAVEVGESYSPPVVPGPEPDAADTEEPSGNASTDAWRRYALLQGASEDDLDGASRDELREVYGTTE